MSVVITEISPQYDAKIAEVIKQVGAEFGAIGEGFGPSDPEVEAMSQHYHAYDASRYFIALVNNKVVGGSGIAPFNGSSEVCELRKLFLLPQSRGLGIGKTLTEKCLEYAKSSGYSQCYLDTLHSMTTAIALYELLGFKHLQQPLAGTIHNGCDVWMLKQL
ncbi:GNAT family N-acetyltransferase [Rheinheimera sp. MMS21-TC3]|uniref:GNAT family N-acetyltransferase n=1 Tax=Rheinheimera sp. MMS21-TC3 TaxID=3072790 RepID=UPI0028C3DA30|nr:GNAT family N-acetyltransferase [Rheinheimera sp. MMS21-TC3]WNO60220.1 GNAT family N-acetyltransferase [Rheinheimera sp. MMS21-TC3]